MKININFSVEIEFTEKFLFWKIEKNAPLVKGKLSFWFEGKQIKASFDKY